MFKGLFYLIWGGIVEDPSCHEGSFFLAVLTEQVTLKQIINEL